MGNLRNFLVAAGAILAVSGCDSGTKAATTADAATTGADSTATAGPTDSAAKFDADKVGDTPAGFTAAKGTWKVVADAAAPSGGNVVEQSAADQDFPVLTYDKAGEFDYGEITVSLKVVSGTKAQAAGVVFRHVDAKNFYTVRINQTEGTWNIFRTIDGTRDKFDPIAGAPGAKQGEYTKLKVTFKDKVVTAWANDVKIIEYTETSDKAPVKGKIGLWTKDDSVSRFDDLSVAHK